MSCGVIDSNYDLSITPSRKRKRESSKYEVPVSRELTGATNATGCFTNAAFSSTPKKLLAKRLLPKEGLKPFPTNPSLEVKSILHIVQEQGAKQKHLAHESKKILHRENPYEVIRKPPKKKKKRAEYVDTCFENPALNLELPEKQFNPFEIHRSPRRSIGSATKNKCFTNEALNIRGKDMPASRNPFEIPRCSVPVPATTPVGVENLAMDAGIMPSTLQIGLPFTPTLGCRIDFKNLPLSELTPGKLLPEKLIFSPVPLLGTKTPKRSLSSISEETMDIGKELDCYQLELENSINEAKLRKCEGGSNLLKLSGVEKSSQLVDMKGAFTQKLSEIVELEEEAHVDLDEIQSANIQSNIAEREELLPEIIPSNDIPNIENTKAKTEKVPLLSASVEVARDEPITPSKPSAAIYSSDDERELDDVIDFIKPTPFVRAYRRPDPVLLTVSKESLHSNKSADKASDINEPKKTQNVKNIIRNSIRKLMHSHTNDKEKIPETAASEKETSLPSSIMSSIRHSLRRKPQKEQLLVEEVTNTDCNTPNEMATIDGTEHTLKLKSNLVQTDYIKIEDLTNEKKHFIRSSLRKSTRGVRQQFLKTVFHKNHEEYVLRK